MEPAAIDRHDELEELHRRLTGDDRLVTLTGPGGCGKSRLARQAATELGRAFSDGASVVELGDLTDAALVAPTVTRALGSLGDPDDRQLLLVLDGCERHLDACAEVVTGLLRGAARVCVLATSRQALRVTGEVVLPVSPLRWPLRDQAADPRSAIEYDAVALFVERATTVEPSFRLTRDNAAAVGAVCARLEGNPLAIELAATRVRVLAPQAILERLDERYRLLSKGAPGAPARLASLRASVEASYQLCSEPERMLWARMSIFSTSVDLDKVEGICSGDGIAEADVIDLVDSLLEKSVLVREDVKGIQVRYRMLESLRTYGAARLSPEQTQHLHQRHLDWCDDLVRTGAREWFGPRQQHWRRRFEEEIANLRAALDQANAQAGTAPYALRMVVGLQPFLVLTGRTAEARHLAEAALQQGTGTTDERIRAVALAAWLATLAGEVDVAEAVLADADAAARSAPAEPGGLATTGLAASALARARGGVAVWRGRYPEAERQLLDAVDLAEPGSTQAGAHAGPEAAAAAGAAAGADAAEAWLLLGLARFLAGRIDQAEDAVRRCLVLTEQADETQLRSYALGCLAMAALRRGVAGAAGSLARDALGRAAALEDFPALAQLLELLAQVAAGQRDGNRAAVLLGAAERLRSTSEGPAGLPPPLASAREAWVTQARELLGERAFDRQVRRGTSLPTEAAVRYALLGTLPEQRRPDEDTPLTRRELEVAELVERGMSNRDIGAVLSISVRTVQGHVENILRRLRFGSRAQIAAWVAERRAKRS